MSEPWPNARCPWCDAPTDWRSECPSCLPARVAESVEERERRYLAKLEAIHTPRPGQPADEEVTHPEDDALLLSLLRELGYYRLAEAWDETPKWYA